MKPCSTRLETIWWPIVPGHAGDAPITAMLAGERIGARGSPFTLGAVNGVFVVSGAELVDNASRSATGAASVGKQRSLRRTERRREVPEHLWRVEHLHAANPVRHRVHVQQHLGHVIHVALR